MIKLKKSNHGFTVIELIVILPIVAFIMTSLIVVAQTTFFRILSNNAEASLKLESQTALFSLQDELLFATDFGEVKTNDLNDPFQPSGGWRYDTDPDTLIIYETSLNAPRREPDREFVYKQIYNCSSPYNPIAVDNVIYFTKDNPDNDYKTLYRRVLTPQYNTCNNNYRDQSCPTEANFGTGGCGVVDNKLSDKVVDFEVEYYDVDNNLVDVDGSGSPLEGEKIKVTLKLGNLVYGKDVEAQSNLTMRKIN